MNMIHLQYFSHTGIWNIKNSDLANPIYGSINIYSIFYVFYDQYLTIWRDTMFSLTISLAIIFAVSFVLVGFDLIAATVIALMVLLIVINMGGMMWLWSISLNAISLVNLVVVSNDSQLRRFCYTIEKERGDATKHITCIKHLSITITIIIFQ